jgi:uncharacterized protein (TIGR03000 family)
MRTFRRSFILGAVLLGCFALASSEASAFWGRGCGCYCGPGYGYGCYGYGGYGWGGYGYGWGGYGYGWGGYGYGWGGYGGYGGYGSWGWYGSSAPVSYYGSVAYGSPANSRPGSSSPVTSLAATATSSADGVLNVKVPAAARVFVNGQLTKSTGEFRRYVSPGLVAGVSYTYEVRAELPGGVNPVTETKTVKLLAGAERSLTFELGAATAKLPTSLTLHVPAEAKVILNGNPTKETGPVRTFKAEIDAGRRYTDYLVRVELERDGKLLTRERKISFAAGEQRELTIEVDSPAPSTVALNARK